MQRLGENLYPKALRDADLLSALADGVIIADADGAILFMNEPALEMHSLTEAELRQGEQHYSDEFDLHGLDDTPVPSADWPVRRVIRSEKFSNLRLRVRRGAAVRVLAYSGTPVEVDGRFAYALLTIRDVSDEERTRRRLAESETRFRTVVEHYPHPMIVYDDSLRVGYLNETAADYLGVQRTAAIGRFHHQLVPEARHLTQPLLERAIADKRTVREELRIRVRGKPVELLLTYVPLFDEAGEVGEVLGFSQDLTEVHRARRELSAMVKELEGFAYAVSHDLKAPLRAVNAFSEILMEEAAENLAPDHRQLLERIKSAGLKMSDLLDGILRLTRITTDPYQPETLDLSELIGRCVDEHGPEASRAEVVYPPRLPVFADGALLLLVVENLLKNAFKFSRHASAPTVAIGVAHDAGGERVCYVADNGVGFEPGHEAELFKPFVRLHAESEFEGTGIGLAVVRRAIERHGGRVWAESEPGAGATFYFTLPQPVESDAA